MILKFIQPMYDSSLLFMIILSVLLHHQELQEVQLWKKTVLLKCLRSEFMFAMDERIYKSCLPIMIQKLMIQTVWFDFCFLAPGCTRSATSYTLEMIHELCRHVQALLSLNAWLKIQFGLERGVMHFQLLLSREWWWWWWWWSLDIVFRMLQKCRVHTF